MPKLQEHYQRDNHRQLQQAKPRPIECSLSIDPARDPTRKPMLDALHHTNLLLRAMCDGYLFRLYCTGDQTSRA